MTTEMSVGEIQVKMNTRVELTQNHYKFIVLKCYYGFNHYGNHCVYVNRI